MFIAKSRERPRCVTTARHSASGPNVDRGELQMTIASARNARLGVPTMAVTMALTMSWQANADDTPADTAGASSDDVQEIVVMGSPIRDSLAASLAVQRAATNVVSAIASDTIGRFPDQTAAAALTRLPAVAVQRDQGQERYIQVRGAPQHWTAVSFNGMNVVGAEDRVFRFDSVPAVLIDSVQLNKTLTPDMPAEALAGRVDIHTFSPLDRPGFDAHLDIGYGYVDLAGGAQEQYAARLSHGGETFGVMLAGSHFEFDQEADNSEPAWSTDGILNRLRTAKYQTTRETNSLSAALEWQPSDGHRLSLTSLYTEFLDHELRNQYTFNFAGAASGTRDTQSGSLVAVPVDGMFEEGDYLTSIHHTALHGEHTLGQWSVDWQLASTQTEDEIDLPLISQVATDRGLRPSLDYRVDDPRFPQITLFDTVSAGSGLYGRGAQRTSLDQLAFDSESVLRYGLGSTSDAYAGKFDLGHEWSSFGAQAQLEFGAQYDDRLHENPGNDALIRPDGTVGSMNLRQAASELGQAWTPIDFVTADIWDEDFERGYTSTYIDNPAMRDQYDAIIAAARASNDAGTGNYAVPQNNRALAYEVTESIASGYLMNTWSWDRHSLLIGARIEQVDIESSGALQAGSLVTPVTLQHSYTDVFPSVHWNVDLTDTLKYRLSAVSGAARPGFSDLRASASISDSSETVSGGNPALEPETAYGADTSLEWYFTPDGLLAANVFYRDVSDVLFTATTTVGDDRYNTGGVDRSGYEYTTLLNGSDGKLYGAELTYYQPWTFLPGFWRGFGFQGSLSFIDGNFRTAEGREQDFPGTSDQVATLSLFYEDHGLSVRLSYQNRSDWIDAVGANAASDLWWESTERWDLSARYQFNNSITVYADGVNLSDELGVRYQGAALRPIEIEGFGRRFMVGVRANF
jgi:TonB-dependent receptor